MGEEFSEGEECMGEHPHTVEAELVIRNGKFFLRERFACGHTDRRWYYYRETTPWVDPETGLVKVREVEG